MNDRAPWFVEGSSEVSAATDHVGRFLATMNENEARRVDRYIAVPSGLDLHGMHEALADPRLAEPGHRPYGIQLMADFMAPEGSRYFDSIYGSFFGQSAIRNWLVPAMGEIEFIDFVPQQEPVVFEAEGASWWLDEWQMFMDLAAIGMGEGKAPLSKGVSVRRCRDGWLDWACDVYDTMSFRQPSPTGEAAPIPAPPTPAGWPAHPTAPVARAREVDFDRDCDQFHPTDSVYIDPIFGEFHGQDEIRAWILDVMPKTGDIEFVPVGPELRNEHAYVQEWVQMAITSNGARVPMTRGTSVRRYRDGWTVYAADYFDVATVLAPEVMKASIECGSTISEADIAKYRNR